TGYPAAQGEGVPYFVGPVDASTPQPRTVLAPGRLTREKGFDLLIDALARLPRPWRAIIAGDGMERQALERHARASGVADAIEFAGWQDEAGMAALYRRAAVVAVPSRWPEPSGIVGLEAMAHGRPVAAFAVGGIPEWLADGVTGLLAPPNDAAALGSAIARLLGDPVAAAGMGEAGRARVADLFSAGRHVQRLRDLYAALPEPAR
ncbi:MAG: glycosyltransferase, partial [Acidobacteriota bacterium]|nr:glycosyltransferase [Acidobacteriota bacterium]